MSAGRDRGISPALGTGWSVVWSDPHERLFVERQHGSDHTRHRFRSNEPGDGAVVVACRGDRVLFVEVYRHVIGRTLLELPRGQADASDDGPVATAARELWEETGYRMDGGRALGRVWPDTGLCGDGVHVVTTFDPEPERVEEAEYTTLRWMGPAERAEALAAGELRDAISLAALALARVLP